MLLNTKKIVVAGLLGAVSIILGFTQLGFIPLPSMAGSATIMHIPVIIAAIIEGPIVGIFVGLIFGISSFIRGAAFFTDPIVAILPRLLIGIVAFYIYKPLEKYPNVAIAIATAAGTITNTIGVLSLAIIRGYLPSWAVAGGIAIVNGLPEVIVAIIIVILVIRPIKMISK